VRSLLLAAIFFAGIHLGVAGTTIPDRAIAALGQSSYRVAFSIATVVGLAWRLVIRVTGSQLLRQGIQDEISTLRNADLWQDCHLVAKRGI
jgi:uncharacterized membrane protein